MEQALQILVVDDEENTRIGLSKLLEGDGHQLLVAANGYEALSCLEENSVDLVLTDINMSGMSGLVLLKEMNERYEHVSVVMLTAYGGVDSYLEAMNLGAFEYINKPVQLKELRSVIRRVVLRRNRFSQQAVTLS